MWIWGFHPVREALRRRPHEIEVLWAAGRRGGPRRAELEGLARRHGIRVEEVPAAKLAELAGGGEAVHNGLAARVSGAESPTAPSGDPDLVALVEDVQDPRNFGALLRVCEGAGVGRVLVRDRGSAPMTPTVVKSSAGAAEWLAVERIPNSAAELDRLKGEGFWVYGADAAGEPVWEVDLRGKVVFCFGGEAKGLRRLTRERCDKLIALPMRGRVQSLNLATAAAAILYEAIRQRTPR
jgi:23S rRNA (guanosine2251-2'-O)-methyltransferase